MFAAVQTIIKIRSENLRKHQIWGLGSVTMDNVGGTIIASRLIPQMGLGS